MSQDGGHASRLVLRTQVLDRTQTKLITCTAGWPDSGGYIEPFRPAMHELMKKRDILSHHHHLNSQVEVAAGFLCALEYAISGWKSKETDRQQVYMCLTYICRRSDTYLLHTARIE
jgi:hypothetical protein